MRGIDGFEFEKIELPLNRRINRWSYYGQKKIQVMDFYLNPAVVEWKGQRRIVGDLELFKMVITGWIKSKMYPLTREQALDLYFEMGE